MSSASPVCHSVDGGVYLPNEIPTRSQQSPQGWLLNHVAWLTWGILTCSHLQNLIYWRQAIHAPELACPAILEATQTSTEMLIFNLFPMQFHRPILTNKLVTQRGIFILTTRLPNCLFLLPIKSRTDSGTAISRIYHSPGT